MSGIFLGTAGWAGAVLCETVAPTPYSADTWTYADADVSTAYVVGAAFVTWFNAAARPWFGDGVTAELVIAASGPWLSVSVAFSEPVTYTPSGALAVTFGWSSDENASMVGDALVASAAGAATVTNLSPAITGAGATSQRGSWVMSGGGGDVREINIQLGLDEAQAIAFAGALRVAANVPRIASVYSPIDGDWILAAIGRTRWRHGKLHSVIAIPGQAAA